MNPVIFSPLNAQQADWQQRVEYKMDVHMDVDTNILAGTQHLTYYNNSPDTLHRVFYHLYYNAFQPGSMMDKRSRTIVDPDGRVLDRIYHLEEDEIGYQKILSLEQDGHEVSHRTEQTILIVDLAEPLLPGGSTVFEMEFEAQVPVQIRRTGRDNLEDIRYSMAQWYPKLAEYDQDGWHTHPYVGREFHGVFGDFDVRITIDRDYTVGATGYLQNPQEVGHGYEDPDEPLEVPDTGELTWHFFAPDVIDFMWGADDKFTHEIYDMEDGPRIHLLLVERPETENWAMLGELTAEAIRFMNDYIGEYPFEQFTIIQGGDGGMEYPMATLITGHRSLFSLTAVTVHELIHMWYQTVLATNESLHHWMDEGFTVYMSSLTMQHLFGRRGDPHAQSYAAYLSIVHDQLEEPMGQHADKYETNAAYVTASYRKGALILHQLEYIVGREVFKRAMQRFYQEWKFRHPTPTDFRRVVENESGMQLMWYFDAMLQSTGTIDLAIKRVRSVEDQTEITLENQGDFLMPVDLFVEFEDGSRKMVNIPRHLMLESKDNEFSNMGYVVKEAWPWTHPEYTLVLDYPRAEIKRIEIDPTNRLADVNRLNNTWPRPYDYRFLQPASQSWNQYPVGYRPAIWYGENSGIRAGLRLEGEYMFGTKQVEASLMLTSGTLSDPEISNADVDYHLSFRDRWRFLGPEGWWNFSLRRYYGINEQRLGIEKQLGRYGRLEPVRHTVDMNLFHVRKTTDRQLTAFNREWEPGSLGGFTMGYSLEHPQHEGLRLEGTIATFANVRAAHQLRFQANKTFTGLDYRLNSRFGMEVSTGSRQLSRQQTYNLVGGSAIERWNDKTWTSVANLDDRVLRDFDLVYQNENGLSGYALEQYNIGAARGNNAVAFTIWNDLRPFRHGYIRPLKVELFAGAGRAWSGNFIRGFELPSPDHQWLASMGTGVSYTFADLPAINRWTAQSDFLSGLKLSVRMPFYLHQVRGDNFDTRFMFGVSGRL